MTWHEITRLGACVCMCVWLAGWRMRLLLLATEGIQLCMFLCPKCPEAVEFATKALTLRHAALPYSGGGMAACSSALPSVFTLVLSALLLLQLLVSLIVPHDTSAPEFTVISINNHEAGSLDSSVDRRLDRAPELWPDEATAERLRAYADENELSSRQVNTTESLNTQIVHE